MLVIAAVFVAVLAPAFAGGAAASATQTSAASTAATSVRPMTLDGFQAGNIISDAVFTNRSTMTADQIQAFFNAKVPSCQSGYTCLKDFRVTSQNRPADSYCSGYSGTANESAASIIYRVAQSCNINPQVLIVMLQKEQGLVTHTWPSNWRYDSALGQGCPDDAPCDSTYVGFFQQIYGAARQMQIYMEGKWFAWYAPGNTWNILYNPNSGCGSGPVTIANKATAALYYYTPYQPNAAALRAGYGEGDSCSAYGNRNFYNYFTDWFGSTQSNPTADNPFGNIELMQVQPGAVAVAGWALDPNTSSPVAVHIYVGPTGTPTTANLPRSDIAAAYPAAGANHGYSAVLPLTGTADTDVCVYAMNLGPGATVLIGCKTVKPLSGSPSGKLDTVKAADGALQISGWAVDPDTAGPIPVHVYVDGVGAPLVADKARTDLPATFSGYGVNHGFETKVSVAAGSHSVCAYAMNAGAGGNVEIGCSTVTSTGTAPTGRVPFGSFEAVTAVAGALNVGGWTIDPDVAAPISVRISVDGKDSTYVADFPRADVGAVYPASGAKHGFSAKIDASAGQHTVCVTALNNDASGDTNLGCRTATVPAPVVDLGRPPLGNLELVTAAPGSVTAAGWAFDPDTSGPIAVHIYVDADGKAIETGLTRTDVPAIYPGAGTGSGFSGTVPATPGAHNVCAYAINNGAGGNVFLGCGAVTVP